MTNYDKLINTLTEVFMLDKAELDFGIYRIMNQKRKDIEQFLKVDLVPQVKKVLAESLSIDKQALQKELDDAIKSAQALGADPDSLPKVQQIKLRLGEAADMVSIENEVFSLLANFFKRYFDNGDFISMRRYKKDVYAIPYEGEEVKLHWANADQYYIKTSEYLKNYRFKLNNGKTVAFELIEASTEQNNNKIQDNKERRFVIYDENPCEVVDNEFKIYFTYEPADKKIKQSDLLADAFDTVKTKIPQDFIDLLSLRPTEKDKQRTLLQKHLLDYTARNTFDYFIHKDLGGFLTRELDFYIKNEVLFIDDLNTRNEQEFLKQLSKIKAIKKIGEKIITFLAQLENFQKKLWLKKKMVVECNYCITLDRVPEEFYPEIVNNQAQINEWINLFAIDKIKAEKAGGLFSPDTEGFINPVTIEFLKQNPYLLLDTAFFSKNIKWKLLSSLDNFDEHCDGLLINSENFQALRLLQEKYKEKIKCVYIDPPYNTGGSGFLYKDAYKHSSWLSMIIDRLYLCKDLILDKGVLYSSIDAVERNSLENALNTTFGDDNRIEEIIWAQNTTKNQSPTFSTNHEYVEVFAKNYEIVKNEYTMFRETKPGFNKIMSLIENLNNLFLPIDEVEKKLRILYKERKAKLKAEGIPNSLDDWKSIYNYNKVEYRDTYGKIVTEDQAKEKNAKIWVWREVDTSMPQVKEDSQKDEFRDPESPTFRFYRPVHPITGNLCQPPKTGWRWPYNAHGNQSNYFTKLQDDDRIVWGVDEKKIPQQKSFLHEVETNVSKSVVNDYADGEKELTNIFGKSRTFSNPKPTSLIKRFCKQAATENSIIMDFFVGSGTTGHAVINLNREDNGLRKYILIEMGSYFDSVLKPRIQKAIYSKDWKDGKPVRREGISHCFKYLRLESYEDTLNNLALIQTEKQQQVLELNPSFKEGYMLNYMLDVETQDSLLNLDWFGNPFNCYLNVTRNNELQPTKVDLVETFNYLIGLVVENYAVPKDGYVVVTGKNLVGESILVVWRDCTQHNSVELNTFLEKSKYNPLDNEFDRIYVNGDNNVENLKIGDERWKVVLIEEEFKKRMFENN